MTPAFHPVGTEIGRPSAQWPGPPGPNYLQLPVNCPKNARYLLMEQWERDDLVHNLTTLLSRCEPQTQERMVWHFLMCEDDLGLRVGEGLGIGPDDVRHLKPLPKQTLTDEERERLANLGKNGRRNVEGLHMTHCIPNERVVVSR